jgi:hypothetical protein
LRAIHYLFLMSHWLLTVDEPLASIKSTGQILYGGYGWSSSTIHQVRGLSNAVQ